MGCIETFEGKALFEESVRDRGLNILCGAGFSVLAKDQDGNNLLTGPGFLSKLKDEFQAVSNYKVLSRACDTIAKTQKTELNTFIRRKFMVETYNPAYNVFPKLRIRSVFTTNVDNLWHKIYENASPYFLNDIGERGFSENREALNYASLHGCVLNERAGYRFTPGEIARATDETDKKWRLLRYVCQNAPLLVWGWNFAEESVLKHVLESNDRKWAILYKGDDYGEEDMEFLRNNGFKIIISDTEDMLNYLAELADSAPPAIMASVKSQAIKKYQVTELCDNAAAKRPEDFFWDYVPHWSYVCNRPPQAAKTRYYYNILDWIAEGKSVVGCGMIASGKTTLLMQLAYETAKSKPAYFLIAPTKEQATAFLKEVGGVAVVVFIDVCFRDTDALVEFLQAPNVQTIAFDRDIYYDRQNYKLPRHLYEPVDISDLYMDDAQAVITSIPEGLRKKDQNNRDVKVSGIFDKAKRSGRSVVMIDVVNEALKTKEFRFLERFSLRPADQQSAELFLLAAYLHSCQTPMSMSTLYYYFNEGQDTMTIVSQACSQIEDCGRLLAEAEDTESYECRSAVLARNAVHTAVTGSARRLYSDMLVKFATRVPTHAIARYDRFKREGFDASLIYEAFGRNLVRAEEFYKACLDNDPSEYTYQQAALYCSIVGTKLLESGDESGVREAFDHAYEWVSKAEHSDYRNSYSIQHTSALIYFNANYCRPLSEETKAEMLLNLDKLYDMCGADKRKHIHYKAYIESVEKFVRKTSCGSESQDLYNQANALETEANQYFMRHEISGTEYRKVKRAMDGLRKAWKIEQRSQNL